MEKVPIFTVGYGAREIEELVGLLKRYGIEYLIYVRSQPYSKYKPEYTKTALQERLGREGMRYVYMGDTLGGRPSDPQCYVNGKVDYGKLRGMEFYREGIARLHTALEKGLRVALMCSEGKPQDCHRSKLVGETLVSEGVEVLHIDETGELRSQDEVINQITHGQQSLFPTETDFRSRKKYEGGQGPGARGQGSGK